MERITLIESNVSDAAEKAAAVLRAGGVVLYPTDTLYGLGADALSDDAVDKVIDMKGRDQKKPIHSIVADMNMAARYAHISGMARILDDELPKGKITFVSEKKEGVEQGISRHIETFGFRIPLHAFCIEMIRAFGGPITATSANRAGGEVKMDVDGILAQLGSAGERIDLVIDGGTLPPSEPSTVIDLTHHHPLILREGAVAPEEIWNALQ